MKIRRVIHRLYFARSGSFTVFANDNTPGAAKPIRSGWRFHGFGTAFPARGMRKATTASRLPKWFAHSFRK